MSQPDTLEYEVIKTPHKYRCSGTVLKNNRPPYKCPYKGWIKHGDKYYCGHHHRQLTGKNPWDDKLENPNKKRAWYRGTMQQTNKSQIMRIF